MKSIEKLRATARNMARGMFLAEHEECNLLLYIANEIEREIAEKYMELPVDADGVPIHVGDELETAHGGKVIVEYVGECEVRVYRDSEHYRISQDEYAYTCSHVKPDPIKELLEEFGDWYKHVAGGCDKPSVIDEYAAKIRKTVSADA